MQTRFLAASLLLLSSYSLSLHAADDTAEPVIVTATRTAQTADETLAAVTVITRKDIERQQAVTVADLLRGTPGVSVANNGGLGKGTSIFLRGTESDHVLVLIDGVKVGSATSGTTAFEDISVDQIERIEIVRGPRSSLYGSEAIGGVIQIFTRKGGGAVTPRFSLGAGSHGTYTGTAGVSALDGGGDGLTGEQVIAQEHRPVRGQRRTVPLQPALRGVALTILLLRPVLGRDERGRQGQDLLVAGRHDAGAKEGVEIFRATVRTLAGRAARAMDLARTKMLGPIQRDQDPLDDTPRWIRGRARAVGIQ